jgi:hypothetical protein
MKTSVGKALILAIAFGAFVPGIAQADVKDRVLVANVAPNVLYQQIVQAATAMCREADSAGEVASVKQCVEIVVAKTISEINTPSLTAYARENAKPSATDAG